MARRRHRHYSPEFKAEALRVAQQSDEPLAKVARDLGINKTTLRLWIDATRPEPREPLTEDEQSELQRLRREVRQLRMERDILKEPRPSSPATANDLHGHSDGEGHVPCPHDVPDLGCRPERFLRVGAAARRLRASVRGSTAAGAAAARSRGESRHVRQPAVVSRRACPGRSRRPQSRHPPDARRAAPRPAPSTLSADYPGRSARGSAAQSAQPRLCRGAAQSRVGRRHYRDPHARRLALSRRASGSLLAPRRGLGHAADARDRPRLCRLGIWRSVVADRCGDGCIIRIAARNTPAPRINTSCGRPTRPAA